MLATVAEVEGAASNPALLDAVAEVERGEGEGEGEGLGEMEGAGEGDERASSTTRTQSTARRLAANRPLDLSGLPELSAAEASLLQASFSAVCHGTYDMLHIFSPSPAICGISQSRLPAPLLDRRSPPSLHPPLPLRAIQLPLPFPLLPLGSSPPHSRLPLPPSPLCSYTTSHAYDCDA